MIKLFVLLLLVWAPSVYSEGPLFRHQEPEKQQEFENVYKDLRTKVSKSSGTLTTPNISSPTIQGNVIFGPSVTFSTGTTVALTTNTDIFTTAYQDYSSLSTVTGWASFTTKLIYYKKIGKLVWVWFQLDGTSNAVTVSFTLPLTSANTVDVWAIMRARDNNVDLTTPGHAELDKNTSTVNCFSDTAVGAWTNANRKIVQGQFSYQTN